MQVRAASCYSCINRKNPAVELGQDQRIEPFAQHRPLSGVFAFKLQNADLQLKDGDGG